MLTFTIGENAGRIWSLLEGNSGMSPSAIGKSLKLKGGDVDRAVGWLAREDKIHFKTAGRTGIKISLK